MVGGPNFCRLTILFCCKLSKFPLRRFISLSNSIGFYMPELDLKELMLPYLSSPWVEQGTLVSKALADIGQRREHPYVQKRNSFLLAWT